MSSSDGPTIVRPIPRRPFDLNLTPTSPSGKGTREGEQHSHPASPSSSSHRQPPPNFLNAGSISSGIDGDSSISRAASMMNLTSSTLSGIYAPTEEPETPWGTGAQTPVKRFTLQEQQDFSSIELDKEHSSMLRRRLSTTRRNASRDIPRSRSLGSISSLVLRALLLFALGTGYGVLVTRLRDGSSTYRAQSFDFDDDDKAEVPQGVQGGLMHPGSDWRYLIFWGATGVVLGGLLPWFDGVWENAFGDHSSAVELDPVVAMENMKKQREQDAKMPTTDWALVVRGIGAFVGIAFAIRRLPWTSSLQASATLALINPFLWYIIDRSKPGFLLSAFVGLAGSAILLGFNPQMMMPPSAVSSSLSGYGNYSSSSGSGGTYPRDGNGGRAGGGLMLGGLASQETVESGVWMLSVLFCSCVCFGNIGRRLDWNRGAAGRGRWGGLR